MKDKRQISFPKIPLGKLEGQCIQIARRWTTEKHKEETGEVMKAGREKVRPKLVLVQS